MRGSWRIVGLWVLLIVLFVAFYQIMGHEQFSSAAATPNEKPWSTILITWAPLFAFFIFFAFLYSRARRHQTLTIEGTRLLGSGRFSQALERFTRVLETARHTGAPLHNIGLTQLALWRLTEARNTFAKVQATPVSLKGLLAGTEPVHALLAALVGEVGLAKAWLAVPSSANAKGVAALTKAAVACREGDFAGALTWLNKPEVKHLGSFMNGVAQALTTLATYRVTGVRAPVDRVLLYGEASADGLKAVWPELTDAVERSPSR